MSATPLPVAMPRLVERPVVGDAPEKHITPPASEEHNALDGMPQGVFLLMAQLQPLREEAPKLSLKKPRPTQTIDLQISGLSVEQAMPQPLKKPSVRVPAHNSSSVQAPTPATAPAEPNAADRVLLAKTSVAPAYPADSVTISDIDQPVAAKAQDSERALASDSSSAPAAALPVQAAASDQALAANEGVAPGQATDPKAASLPASGAVPAARNPVSGQAAPVSVPAAALPVQAAASDQALAANEGVAPGQATDPKAASLPASGAVPAARNPVSGQGQAVPTAPVLAPAAALPVQAAASGQALSVNEGVAPGQTTDPRVVSVSVIGAVPAARNPVSGQAAPVSVPAAALPVQAAASGQALAVNEGVAPGQATDPKAVSVSASGAVPAARNPVPGQGQAVPTAPVSAPAVELPVRAAASGQAPVAHEGGVSTPMQDPTPISVGAEVGVDVSTRQNDSLLLATIPLPDRSSHNPLPAKRTAPAQATPGSRLSPEVASGTSERHYLQVPFGRGNASGLITVSKANGEGPEQLLLSPSNTSVFNYLSDNLAHVANPRWRLADQQGHEQGHGHGRGNEQADEDASQTNRNKRERGRDT